MRDLTINRVNYRIPTCMVSRSTGSFLSSRSWDSLSVKCINQAVSLLFLRSDSAFYNKIKGLHNCINKNHEILNNLKFYVYELTLNPALSKVVTSGNCPRTIKAISLASSVVIS